MMSQRVRHDWETKQSFIASFARTMLKRFIHAIACISVCKWKLLSRVRLLRPRGLYSPWNSLGQNTGVGCHFLLQGIFPTQGSNPGLLNCRWILYHLSQKSMFGFFFQLMRIHSLYIHPNVFVHESARVHLDCFWFGAIITNAVMSNHVHVLLWTCIFIFLGQIPRNVRTYVSVWNSGPWFSFNILFIYYNL